MLKSVQIITHRRLVICLLLIQVLTHSLAFVTAMTLTFGSKDEIVSIPRAVFALIALILIGKDAMDVREKIKNITSLNKNACINQAKTLLEKTYPSFDDILFPLFVFYATSTLFFPVISCIPRAIERLYLRVLSRIETRE